jgi:predicted transcriptional regulator
MRMVGRRAHGQLKTTVLALLREADGPVSARMLLERWPDGEPRPAFTTVITVLTRLLQAGAVERVEGAEARFRVRHVAGGVAAESMLAALFDSADRGAALMSFAEQLDPKDLDVLRRAVGGSGSA